MFIPWLINTEDTRLSVEVVTARCTHVSRMTSWFGDFSVAALFEVWQHPSKKACREAFSVVCSQAHSDSWISPILQEELCIHWGEYFIGNGHGDFLGNNDAISFCRQAVGRRPVQTGLFFIFFLKSTLYKHQANAWLERKGGCLILFYLFFNFWCGEQEGEVVRLLFCLLKSCGDNVSVDL